MATTPTPRRSCKLETDQNGYIIPLQLQPNHVPGVFVAGDVRITLRGGAEPPPCSGCMAALERRKSSWKSHKD